MMLWLTSTRLVNRAEYLLPDPNTSQGPFLYDTKAPYDRLRRFNEEESQNVIRERRKGKR